MPKRTSLRKTASPDILATRLLLRVKEYSDLTGTPPATVYALVAAGKIPGVVRIGSSIRIPADTLRKFVA